MLVCDCSPAKRMRSAAVSSCVFGASAVQMQPKDKPATRVSIRHTAARTSAAPSTQVTLTQELVVSKPRSCLFYMSPSSIYLKWSGLLSGGHNSRLHTTERLTYTTETLSDYWIIFAYMTETLSHTIILIVLSFHTHYQNSQTHNWNCCRSCIVLKHCDSTEILSHCNPTEIHSENIQKFELCA